ncbi:hypothetical protein FNF31_07348 [Cafeteria roenbergensis]|uniref:Cilia- and flagella-associated protein 251 n=1 Tax=Cafeteria roenbergensis TaxID=33653 RepID=A0A5A8C9E5_CAFRO|nr:hypothetical protein FNF31_07348 [Cafeteria roenbergensis]
MADPGEPAMSAEWVFGFNCTSPECVHSLATEEGRTHELMYSAAHHCVVYDFRTQRQSLLQGHTASITALDVSADKRWAATVDAAEASPGEGGEGGEGLLVVWDVAARAPVRSVAQPHAAGCVAVAFSADSSRVATLAAPFTDPETGATGVQEVAVWDWAAADGHDRPAAVARVPSGAGLMSRVAFHPLDRAQLVTTGPERVVFWGVDPAPPAAGPNEDAPPAPGTMSFFVPALGRASSTPAALTATAFLPWGTDAVTGTTDGRLLVWSTPAAALAEGRVLERTAAKLVQLVEESEGLPPAAPGAAPEAVGVSTVRVLAVSPPGGEDDEADKGFEPDAGSDTRASRAAVVVGFTDGAVRVFDGALRLLAWYEDLAAGPVTSVSFAAGEAFEQGGPTAGVDLPDFVVGTSRALVVGVQSSLAGELDAEARRGTLLVQGFDSGVFGAAAHPDQPLVVTGTREGTLSVWDVRSRELQVVRLLREEAEEAEEARVRAGGERRPPQDLFGEGAFAVTAAAWRPDGRTIAVAVGARAVAGGGAGGGAGGPSDGGGRGGSASGERGPTPAGAAGAGGGARPGTTASRKAGDGAGGSDGADGGSGGAPGYIRLVDADSLEDTQAPLGGRRGLRGGGLQTQASAQSAGASSLDGGPAGAITALRFSADGQWLASTDSAGVLCLWRHSRVSVRADEGRKEWQLGAGEADEVHEELRWVYVGRARPHTGDIVGIDWTTDPTEGHARLVTVGSDRRVAEIDVLSCSADAGVVVGRPRVRIEHTATPTACCWVHPSEAGIGGAAAQQQGASGGPGGSAAAEAAATAQSTELLLATASDEMKLRLFSGGTKTCRRTVAAPEFAGAIAFLGTLRSEGPAEAARRRAESGAAAGAADGAPGVMVFGAAERSAGVVMLPLDGNPNASAGVLAHPGQMAAVLSVVGDRVVTVGGDDGTLAVWRVSRGRLAELRQAGGSDMEPFLATLPGGGSGAFFQELCDFFAYAQMRSQGEESTQPRRTGDTLPLSELPSLVRALGVFPTEAEAEALCTEVRFGGFGESGKTREEVDLAEAVRLFVNHRPAMGVGKGALADALSIISKHTGPSAGREPGAVRWGRLRRALATSGEPMTEAELDECLLTLTGSRAPLGADAPVTAEDLAFRVLGFVDPEAPDEPGV